MKVSIHTQLDLGCDIASAPSVATWFDAYVHEEPIAARQALERCQSSARFAIIHVGELADYYEDIHWPASHTPLASLVDLYFAEGWYKDEFAEGAGIDLLYFASTPDRAANRPPTAVDLALVRRICDTLGSACQLAVIGYGNAAAAAAWAKLGFEITTKGRTSGMMHLNLGFRPHVVASDDHSDLAESLIPPPARRSMTH